jgi:hypothetical protein
MDKLIEQIDDYIFGDVQAGGVDVDYDEELFDKMVDFIISLDPDQLTEDQLNAVTSIIEEFEFDEQVDDGEVSEARFLKKTTRAQRRKQKLWRKRNKAKIKAYRRKNKQKLKRARKTGRGLTGRRRGLFKRRPGGPKG